MPSVQIYHLLLKEPTSVVKPSYFYHKSLPGVYSYILSSWSRVNLWDSWLLLKHKKWLSSPPGCKQKLENIISQDGHINRFPNLLFLNISWFISQTHDCGWPDLSFLSAWGWQYWKYLLMCVVSVLYRDMFRTLGVSCSVQHTPAGDVCCSYSEDSGVQSEHANRCATLLLSCPSSLCPAPAECL